MTLGIFLALGDSFENMSKTGQDIRYKKFYLKIFSKKFSKVYIFSYANEKVTGLPHNVEVIPNRYNVHRYLYGPLLPFLNFTKILKCDVIRCYHLSGTVPAQFARIFFFKPYVFNFAFDYRGFAKIEKKNIQVVLFRLVQPPATFLASKIFAATRQIYSKLKSAKTAYLPNGVDTDFFKPSKRKIDSKKMLVLAVGRLETQKNYFNLIKALSGINAKLLIIGTGSLKGQLQNLAKEKAVDLEIIDNVPNTQMPPIYRKADIFILPSLIEGHPKVLLEAMASGLPVIGANVEGIREIIKNHQNGLLCDTEPQSIREPLKKLMKHRKLRDQIAKEARLSIQQNFELEKLLLKEISHIKNVQV